MSRFTSPAKKIINPQNITVIILAAGLCKKYKSKSLFNVYGKPLLLHQIDTIRERFGDVEIICVLGHEFKTLYKLIPKRVRVIENENYRYTTSAKSAVIGLRSTISESAILIHGDMLFSKNIFHDNVYETYVLKILNNSNQQKIFILEENDCLKGMSYGIMDCNQWGQIVLLKGDDIKNFINTYDKLENINPHMYEVINKMIDCGSRFLSVPVSHKNLREINSSRDLEI